MDGNHVGEDRRNWSAPSKQRVEPGAYVLGLRFQHSEVCMHMKVAGLVGNAQLLPTSQGVGMVQLFDLEWRPIGAPVTSGEAGLYSDDEGFYCYADGPVIGFGSERYRLDGGQAVAWRLLGWAEYGLEGDDLAEADVGGLVRAVMVGDDRVHEFGTDELVRIEETDYCGQCGQIGCGHG